MMKIYNAGVYVETSKNSSFCISAVTQTINLKLFNSFNIISVQINELEFYDEINCFLNVCNRSSCRKF